MSNNKKFTKDYKKEIVGKKPRGRPLALALKMERK
ncbi:hypothetical protein SAMN05446037_101743 [Anaerovirgula multivorans]|uniref:Uncharacterized protein n=1 Tax=Anaerovirgula multivorans TaxID=312168 RepID=A0A239GKF3_9FIRM|nr:hypothetical protein SAMN05446037_101743 [Anaerovirgula multivorans]